MNVAALRDEGEPDPPVPEMLEAKAEAVPHALGSAGIREIFDGYRRELQRGGKARNADTRWSPVIGSLIEFLNHDDARRVTRRDVIRWKDALSEKFAPKTVRDFYLATARATFNWALDNDLVESNPVAGVKIQVARRVLGREKGFNDEEALAIVKAALAYRRPSKREHPTTVAAKRWAPILAAYSGARIAEITQLRKEDVRQRNGITFMRVTPEAGSVKTNVYRDVPLHPHLIELGFLDFVNEAKPGPLFYRGGPRTGRAHPSRIVGDRVGKWIRQLGIADVRVAPNHGWRHRLKTVGLEAGIDSRVLDAIQGHAPRTAGEAYGDVSLKAKRAAIERIPPIA
jgi:integrase